MKPDAPPAFGELLKYYRRRAGLSQTELAERAFISREGVSALERGINHAPHRDTLQLLAAALQLSPDERQKFESAVRQARAVATFLSTPSVNPSALPALSPNPSPHSLPRVLTPLIGREREEAAIIHLLHQEQVRLLTLTGPAGVGKTRLAIQVATTVQHDIDDGVAFVALAALTEPRDLLPALAHALGVQESSGQPLDELLITSLRNQTRLIILDNFEHLLAAGTYVVNLLNACPNLKIVVTSRSVLHVRGEHELAVPPLAFPEDEDTAATSVDDLAHYAAVALFAQRAQAALPTFALTPAVSSVVAATCKHLDGLPLAIELAAARIKMLSPSALLARIEQNLAVLSGGARDLPERQQTMRDAIAWSYRLLSADEQALFRQLSVFRGGCTMEAAEAVCVLAGDAADTASTAHTVLDVLTALVEQSLVLRMETAIGEPRFRLLMTLREYGKEQLEASGQAEQVRRRHADYYLALAEQADAKLVGSEQENWLALLEMEHDNLRAALRWAQEREDIERGLRLASGIWRFWYLHGYFSEGRRWFDLFLTRSAQQTAISATILARAYLNAGRLAIEKAGEAGQAADIERLLADVEATPPDMEKSPAPVSASPPARPSASG